MKQFYLSISLLFLSFFCHAQNTATQDSLAKQDSTKRHRVLLIPYDPKLHLSDADKDIAEYSNKDPETLRKMFRMGLTQRVNSKIFEIYDSQSLLTDYSKNSQEDLDIIYGSLNYAMEDIMVRKDTSSNVKAKTPLSKEKKAAYKESKYFNVKLSHPAILKMLSEKYGTDIFVFMSQVEIKTHYDDCLDLALKIYQREIRVHFAIFNKEGKQLAGDVAVALFPSNSNDIGEIMSANFPLIASYIAGALPKN